MVYEMLRAFQKMRGFFLLYRPFRFMHIEIRQEIENRAAYVYPLVDMKWRAFNLIVAYISSVSSNSIHFQP